MSHKVQAVDSEAEIRNRRVTRSASKSNRELEEEVRELSAPLTSNDMNPTASPGKVKAPASSSSSSSPSVPTSKPKRKRFRLIRSLALADFITLSNAASGTSSIFLCLNYLENSKYEPYLYAAFVLLPLALIFDIMDGSVARWRGKSSPYGADLDSLADVVSFSVSPAVLGFTLGLRGFWDSILLSFFVCCGIARLARYNVTSEALSAGTGKVKYYEGFPVPTSLIIVMILGFCFHYGAVYDAMLGGKYVFHYGSYSNCGTFHPFSLLYCFFGCMQISEVKIKKP